MMKTSLKNQKGVIFILTFLFNLHLTPTLYINSSFLGQFVDDSKIGLIFTLSSILAILGLIFIPFVLRRIGNFKTFLFVSILETVCLLCLAFLKLPIILISVFIILGLTRTIAYFNIDIFLEHSSKNNETGNVRGVFLTCMSLATILGPLMASFVLTNKPFSSLYLLSAILMIPAFIINIKYLRKFEDNHYKPFEIKKALAQIFKNKDLHAVNTCNFLLNLFYSWMVIYIPLYLHEHIGFSLPETTLIIAIALLPFILFDVIWGNLADKRFGEKELMTAGFIILSISTVAISFIDKPIFIVWAVVLFITRIGASLVETMVETYMFKKIDDEDTEVLSLYRITALLSYIAGPLLASVLFIFVDFKFLFLILGTITLYGITYSLSIKDTR